MSKTKHNFTNDEDMLQKLLSYKKEVKQPYSIHLHYYFTTSQKRLDAFAGLLDDLGFKEREPYIANDPNTVLYFEKHFPSNPYLVIIVVNYNKRLTWPIIAKNYY